MILKGIRLICCTNELGKLYLHSANVVLLSSLPPNMQLPSIMFWFYNMPVPLLVCGSQLSKLLDKSCELIDKTRGKTNIYRAP